MYLDTTYIAKFYFNEPESPRVRELVRKADTIHSSLWALAEFHAVIHRRLRDSSSSPDSFSINDARDLASRFSEHIEQGLWIFVPVHEALLRRTSALIVSAPRDLFIRTADAVHLVTAHDVGEREVWTNDRHMLAATGYFGLGVAAPSRVSANGSPTQRYLDLRRGRTGVKMWKETICSSAKLPAFATPMSRPKMFT